MNTEKEDQQEQMSCVVTMEQEGLQLQLQPETHRRETKVLMVQ